MYDQQIGNMNPIWSNFVCFLMKYNHIRMEVRFGEDGNIEVTQENEAELKSIIYELLYSYYC